MQTDTDSTYREVDLEKARWLQALGHHVEWRGKFSPWRRMHNHRNFYDPEDTKNFYRVREK